MTRTYDRHTYKVLFSFLLSFLFTLIILLCECLQVAFQCIVCNPYLMQICLVCELLTRLSLKIKEC